MHTTPSPHHILKNNIKNAYKYRGDVMTSVSWRVICIEKRPYNGTPFLYSHCHMNGLTKYRASTQISGKYVFL